jgi:hypothetical protein
MSNINKTLYIYDKGSGIISYTINSPTSKQISNLKNKGTSIYLGDYGKTILDNYVTLDANTAEPNGIARIQKLNANLVFSDTKIVGNGSHSISVSGFPFLSAVIIQSKDKVPPFIPMNANDSIEFSASDFSKNSNENKLTFSVVKYGHLTETISVPIIEDPNS